MEDEQTHITFYIVFLLLGTIAVSLFIHSVTSLIQEQSAIITDSQTSVSNTVATIPFTIIAIIVIMGIFYGIGLYKFRRWVLPLVITFSFITLLIGILKVINFNFTSITDLIILLAVMTFMGLAGFASIKYWSVSTGPARKLLIQIPLLLALLPFIVFATLLQLYPDDSQINDEDLVLQPTKILPKLDNAHYSLPDTDNLSLLQQQNYEAVLTYAKEIDEESLNNPKAIDLVHKTKELTDSYIDASDKRGYQCPTLLNNLTY